MVALVVDDPGRGVDVAIGDIRPGPSPRNRINFAQVAALAELEGGWEPILVQRSSMVVVDGQHRLAAATRLGHTTVRVRYFDGSDAAARVEAVRLNVRHGLPLTLFERNAAARQLLQLFPEWSDRQLAGVCALSPSTIAKVRSELASVAPTPKDTGTTLAEKRIGKDGKHYPSGAAALRTEIRRVLEQDSGASLRSVAARTGASPETVRGVKRLLRFHILPLCRNIVGTDGFQVTRGA